MKASFDTLNEKNAQIEFHMEENSIKNEQKGKEGTTLSSLIS